MKIQPHSLKEVPTKKGQELNELKMKVRKLEDDLSTANKNLAEKEDEVMELEEQVKSLRSYFSAPMDLSERMHENLVKVEDILKELKSQPQQVNIQNTPSSSITQGSPAVSRQQTSNSGKMVTLDGSVMVGYNSLRDACIFGRGGNSTDALNASVGAIIDFFMAREEQASVSLSGRRCPSIPDSIPKKKFPEDLKKAIQMSDNIRSPAEESVYRQFERALENNNLHSLSVGLDRVVPREVFRRLGLREPFPRPRSAPAKTKTTTSSCRFAPYARPAETNLKFLNDKERAKLESVQKVKEEHALAILIAQRKEKEAAETALYLQQTCLLRREKEALVQREEELAKSSVARRLAAKTPEPYVPSPIVRPAVLQIQPLSDAPTQPGPSAPAPEALLVTPDKKKMTESKSGKTRAAVVTEVSEDRFSLQEVALDEAKNDIASLNGWVERVDAKFTKKCQRLGQEIADRQDNILVLLETKVRTLETEVRRLGVLLPQVEIQLQHRQSALVEGAIKKIREEIDTRETNLLLGIQTSIRDEAAKAMKKCKDDILIKLRRPRIIDEGETPETGEDSSEERTTMRSRHSSIASAA
ncbi:hypothetical protein OUZ56_029469 [Daphnia magna]|uniref:Uncharacterized protein n=1 Tax=Daphnia magna TaxID=35525 RepID=A0ABR0B6X1_9CRUS|nr:hypothetical protein OUZ56_029469 [Daphnia magna]